MTYSSKNQIDQLKEFKRKLDSKHMSVLVGAGFSVNISNIFPLWGDLLHDMVLYLYGNIIEEEFENLPPTKRKSKTDFIQKKIERYIQEVGYLVLVSNYIKRKGFQEAITAYIEDKTPKLITENNERYLVNTIKGKSNKELLIDSMLDTHKLLLSLNWNNIYTTNYDEMLELAIGVDSEKNLSKIFKEINNDIELLSNQIEHNKKEYQDLKNKLKKIELDVTPITSQTNFDHPIQYPDEYHEIKSQINKIEANIAAKERQIKQNGQELFKVQMEIDNCLQVVTHSSKLGVKRNKNIIKLHGTLRQKDDPYGFDNDKGSHYIISKEDYESYPTKHEAFTQLMRISLLQESYCLIGFSGDDPNFLEWIKWVRDVLAKQDSNSTDYKIYLISFGSKNWTTERNLFFENYRIYPINLEEESVIEFLERESNTKISKIKYAKNKRKELLALLFSYLKTSEFDTPNIFLEHYQLKKYQSAWNSINLFDIKKIDWEDIISKHKIIHELSGLSWYMNFDWHNTRTKKDILTTFPFITEFLLDYPKKEKIIDLMLIALNEICIPYNRFWNNSQIDTFKSLLTKNQLEKFNAFTIRIDLLENNKNILSKIGSTNTDTSIYERILHFAFLLDFKSLKQTLKSWHPNTGSFILKKSGFISMLNNTSNDYLTENKAFFESGSPDLLLCYYQYCNYLSTRKFNDIYKANDNMINRLENKGYTNLIKTFETITKDIDKNNEKIDRYGSKKFTISHNLILSNDFSHLSKSIQFLHILIETGLPLRFQISNLQDESRWYKIVNYLKNDYPYPCLFYTLHYENEKFLRRIGQDFSYSSELNDFLNKCLPMLLKAYLDTHTPYKIKRSILYFSSELFITVDVSLWQDLFFKIWCKKEFLEQAFDSRLNEEYILVIQAIPFINDLKIIRNIVHECLKRSDDDNSVEFLYYLSSNKNFNEIKNLQTRNISINMDILISDLNKKTLNWFIVGNLHSILTKKQLDAIKKQLSDFDYINITNPRVWQIIYYFMKDFSLNLESFKNALVNDKNMFRSGLDQNSRILTGGIHHIDLNFTYTDNKIFWTKEHKSKIYNKIKKEFNRIKLWKNKREESSFTSLLQDMFLFLNIHKDHLQQFKSYSEITTQIMTIYFKDRGFNSIHEALSSDDQNQILWALPELSLMLDKRLPETINDEISISISIILNRIISRNLNGFEAILNYLSAWLKSDVNQNEFRSFDIMLKLILRSFLNSLPDGIDIPYVLKQLISISESYSSIFGPNEVTEAWNKEKEKQRFFNY